MKNRIYNTGILLALGLAAAMTFTCVDPVLPPDYLPAEARVPSLNARYADGMVRLEWEHPENSNFNFYRIYRTIKTDSLGDADKASLYSSDNHRYIESNKTSFNDLPEPYNGVYFYAITTVLFEDRLLGENWVVDTIESSFSPLVRCTVGTSVNFAINGGDIFVEDTICHLYIDDPRNELLSVRFTQLSAIDTIDETGNRVRLTEAEGGLIENDADTQLTHMVLSGFFSSVSTESELDKNSRRVIVPLFDADDPGNPQRTVAARNVAGTPFRWILTLGSGEKRVFCEYTYIDNRKDTAVDLINTQPHKIELVIRNERGYGWEGATAKDSTEKVDATSGTRKVTVLYNSTVEFSVKIFGDETIEPEFDCWMITAQVNENMSRTQFPLRPWYMTRPRTYALTGIGDLHNSDTVYTFSVDPALDEGRENLEVIRAGDRFKFGDDLAGIVEENSMKFNHLREAAARGEAPYAPGRKGFMLVFRFREVFFKGAFVSVFGYDDTTEVVRLYRDMFLPTVHFQTNFDKNPFHIGNKDEIVGPFTFALDSMSVVDYGFARISGVTLVIARKPSWLDWENDVVRKSLTLAELLLMRNNIYPFRIDFPTTVINYVRWNDIDPGSWPSGEYIMGIAVEDEFGNSGFAHVSKGEVWDDKLKKMVGQNPWLVTIKTSY